VREKILLGIGLLLLLLVLLFLFFRPEGTDDEAPTDPGAMRSTPPLAKRQFFPELGVAIEYPANWGTNASPMPYATCNVCTVIGPSQPDHPYGVQFWKTVHQVGCQLTCYYLTIRTLPHGSTYAIDANGHVALRQEFERQRPLGLVNEDGDNTTYREILTVVPLAPIEGLPPEAEVPALLIDAFYRYGDTIAEAQTSEALANLLASLEIE
jgi:hypothetical protein